MPSDKDEKSPATVISIKEFIEKKTEEDIGHFVDLTGEDIDEDHPALPLVARDGDGRVILVSHPEHRIGIAMDTDQARELGSLLIEMAGIVDYIQSSDDDE